MTEGAGVGALPLHRMSVQPADEPAEHRHPEELGLGHEVERPRGGGPDDGGIEHAHVVGGQQESPLARDVLGAHRPEPEEEAEGGVGQKLQESVEHTRSTSLAISSITSSTVMPLESM